VAVGVQLPLLPQPALVLADQVGVIETWLLSVSKPVAVNVWLLPRAIAANVGVTMILASAPAALVTWSVAVPTISPDVALTVKVPVAVGVQLPLLPQPALVLADQVGVIETWLLSVSKPVAVNVWLLPRAIAANGGVTMILASAAAALVTWSVAVPTISPDVALTVKVPVAVGVQLPLLPQPALVLADQVGVIETWLLSVSK